MLIMTIVSLTSSLLMKSLLRWLGLGVDLWPRVASTWCRCYFKGSRVTSYCEIFATVEVVPRRRLLPGGHMATFKPLHRCHHHFSQSFKILDRFWMTCHIACLVSYKGVFRTHYLALPKHLINFAWDARYQFLGFHYKSHMASKCILACQHHQDLDLDLFIGLISVRSYNCLKICCSLYSLLQALQISCPAIVLVWQPCLYCFLNCLFLVHCLRSVIIDPLIDLICFNTIEKF